MGSEENLNDQFLEIASIKDSKEWGNVTVDLVHTESSAVLREFAGGISHELGQPLNVLKIICQSLIKDVVADRLDAAELKESLPDMMDQISKIALILDHMFVFTRDSKDKEKEKFNTSVVVEDSFKLIGQQLEDEGIDVVKELDKGMPMVFGYPSEIEEVVLNFIYNARNALRAVDREEKQIKVKTYVKDESGFVVIEVSDNAGGIPEDDRKKIFQPFYTNKDNLAPDGKPVAGKGLGLAISSKLVSDNDGAIELESTVGEGSTFKVILPIPNVKEDI